MKDSCLAGCHGLIRQGIGVLETKKIGHEPRQGCRPASVHGDDPGSFLLERTPSRSAPRVAYRSCGSAADTAGRPVRERGTSASWGIRNCTVLALASPATLHSRRMTGLSALLTLAAAVDPGGKGSSHHARGRRSVAASSHHPTVAGCVSPVIPPAAGRWETYPHRNGAA